MQAGRRPNRWNSLGAIEVVVDQGDADAAVQIHVVDHDELRVARPVVGEAEDLVTHRDATHLRIDLRHDAGQIAALPRGEGRRPAPVSRALPDHHLAGLDPSRADLDQNLPGAGRRTLYLLDRLDSVPVQVLSDLGRIEFDCEVLATPAADQRLRVFTPPPGGAEALDMLRVLGPQHRHDTAATRTSANDRS